MKVGMTRWGFHGVFLIVSIVIVFLQGAVANPAMFSPDGAFALYAPSTVSNSRFSKTLVAFEKQFYKVTSYAPSPAPPVVVLLQDSVMVPKMHPSLRMDVLDEGLPKIQVELADTDIGNAGNSSVLAQALLLRDYYSNRAPNPGSHIADFPSWLLHGLGNLCNTGVKPVVIPVSYLRGATPPSIADLLIQKVSEDGNQEILGIYDAMAASLVSAGLKEGSGRSALRAWIGRFDPSSPLHHPSTWPPAWDMKSVERRWLLMMAGTSGKESGVVTLLGVGETLDRYDTILLGVTTPNHSLALLKKEKSGVYSVQEMTVQLVALRLEANPMVAPLLDETILLCEKFKRFSEKKIAEREKLLSEKRLVILKRFRSVNAYLDWFEAAKLPISSGLFQNVMHEPELPIKKGPVGRHLDAVEARGW